jgi:magnesium-protoporphyrin IX monomethyl ester (oxidative) cyclase
MPPSFLRDVFPALKTPKTMMIHYDLKVPLKEQDVAAMADARVLYATPGFESLNTSTLRRMAKGVTSFANIELMRLCTMYGIRPLWGLLVGSPGEPTEVYEKYVKDIPRLIHFPPPTGLFTIKFHRYSPYWKFPEKYGLKLEPHDYYSLVYPLQSNVLMELAYEFSDRSAGEYKVAVAKWFDKMNTQINHWKDRWREDAERPHLFLKTQENGESIVYDSRGAAIVEHSISEVGRQILESLSEHKRMQRLTSALPHVSEAILEREFAILREKDFFFEEGDTVLSLVLPRNPRPMTECLSGNATENAQGTRVRRVHKAKMDGGFREDDLMNGGALAEGELPALNSAFEQIRRC